MADSSQYTRYFYHCFPQWIGSQKQSPQASYDSALRVLSLMFRWGLLLTPEEIIFQGESYTDEEPAPSLPIVQKRLCFTELSEDELPNHAQIFGPIALEFDQSTLRRIGGMPVIYIPQSVSENPDHAKFGLLGQTFVYRLVEIYQLLSDLAEIDVYMKQLPASEVSVTLEHAKRGCQLEYPTGLLRHFLENLTYKRQPLTQLASALRIFACLFYPTDASSRQLEEGDGRLSYYREREWRLVSDLHFDGKPLDEELPFDAITEISKVLSGSFCPYNGHKLDGPNFTRGCKIIRTFCERPIMNSIRRILVPGEISERVEEMAEQNKYTGIVATYKQTSNVSPQS
jgi:hypothetical protein